MIPKKHRLLFFTGIGVLIVLSLLIYKYYRRAPLMIYERMTNSESSQSNLNNLITNGDFSNGEKTGDFVGWSGTNLIQLQSNPGTSNYVLKQSRSTNKTYYQLNVTCIPNNVYVFRCLVSFEGLMTQPDLESLIKFNIPNSSGTNVSPNTFHKIIKKIVLDNNNTWYEIQYAFRTPSDSDNTVQIFLNYTTNLQASNIYFTNLEFYRVLPEAIDFTELNNLICFLSADQYLKSSTGSNKWLDITNSDYSFQFNAVPLTDTIIGGININDNKLTGPALSTLLGYDTSTSSENLNEFTCNLVFKCNESYTKEEKVTLMEEEIPSNEESSTIDSTPNALTIPGNNGNGIQLFIPNCQGRIKLVFNGSQTFYSDRQLVFYVKSVITLVYSNSMINVFQDGVNVLSAKIDAFYPNNNPITINSDFNWNATLFGIQFYNSKLSIEEMGNIYKYFVEKSCSTGIDSEDFNMLTNSEVYDYDNSFQNDMDNSSSLTNTRTVSGESVFSEYSATNGTTTSTDKSSTVYNNITETSMKCRQDCMTMCAPFLNQASLGSDMQDYQMCISNCKNSLPSCNSYCNTNNDSELCGTGTSEESEINECPIAYKKNGQYTIYIDPESNYAQTTGRSGEIQYGPDRENAAYIYQKNFPNCSLPDSLTASGGNDYRVDCPFKIQDNNPCDSDYCSNIDWSKTDDECAAEMNKECKHMVANYCEINNQYDDSCLCWRPENRDKPACRDFRMKFQNPNDYQCSSGSHPISEHPDYSKYIKRDEIPCWGCNP